MERVIVIGGGYAGVLAALRADARGRGQVEVVLVSDADALTERIRLHEAIARGRDPRRPIAELLRGTGVRFVHGRCDDVDVRGRTVSIGGERLAFDRLVVAIGSTMDRDAIPGAREHAHAITPESAAGVRAALEGARRVVIVGGGLTAIEMAAELAEARPGLAVTLVAGSEIGERFSRGAHDHALRALARIGVEVRERTRVERIEAGAVIAAGERIPFDACVCAVGFRAPGALRAWGFPVDALGRARVDAMLRLEGAPHVYVAGDAAAVGDTAGSPVVAGCKTAMPMGARAGENAIASLRGAPERPLDWVDVLTCVSLGRRDGVVQFVDAQGRPREGRFLAHRTGALVKEMICRFTVWSLRGERDGSFRYRYAVARRRALPVPEAEEAA